MIVRIGSHRANAKLQRANLGHVELYRTDLSGGYYAEVPDDKAKIALTITGITRVRNQNRDAYAKTWSRSSHA